MSGRIEKYFAARAHAGRKSLVTFIMGGDGGMNASQRLLNALPAAGADIIEIGFPFSDPTADGPVIQQAGLRALEAGITLHHILALVKIFRARDENTPLILMGYYNPVYRFGTEAFCKQATRAGVDGIILVDLPPEEEDEFVEIANRHSLRLIRLIAPTTDDQRLAMLSHHASGFLYYISVAGITGGKSAEVGTLKKRVRHIKSKTLLPVAVGFGIKTPRQAAEIAAFSDAVVVGSALVDIHAKKKFKDTIAFVSSLRRALDRASRKRR